jgi:hypothetical protein
MRERERTHTPSKHTIPTERPRYKTGFKFIDDILALSSERAPPKRTKTALVFMINKSGHESQKGLDTKTDWLTDRQP